MKKTVKERWNQVEAAARAFARRVLPRPYDDEKSKLFKTIAWSLLGMLFLVVFLSVSVFFLTLRGEEETMVPQIVGKELSAALLELQEKELVAFVQVKFSEDPRDKGNVVAQDPQGGLLAKAGRRVTLWVSKGAIVDSVENFVGQSLNDVQLRLKTLFSTQATPLLSLASEPIYTFNSAPEGTVLEQKPLPGTPVASPTKLTLVVSKGPKGQTVKAGKYTDRTWSEALSQLIADNRPFVVEVRKPEAGEKPGFAVAQSPLAGAEMAKSTPVALTITAPTALADGRVFQVLNTTLPEFPILVDVRIDLRTATGDQSVLYQFKHPGGKLTVPFVAQPGDQAVVLVLDKEVYVQKVGE